MMLMTGFVARGDIYIYFWHTFFVSLYISQKTDLKSNYIKTEFVYYSI